MASSCGAPPRGGTLHGPHEGRRSLGEEPHSAAATRSPRSVAEVGGPQRVPCSATPCGARHGAPLRNPGARPPRATEPHARRSGPHAPRAAPRSPRRRFCSTYHGNTVPGLPPGSGSPRGPAALTAPSSVTFARCKQSQAAPGRACRYPGSGSAVQWAGLLPPRPGVCSSHRGRCSRSPGASRVLRNLRASLPAGAALKRQFRPYSPRS